MSSNLRRGLLGTLFAGGLLALGCTAANAADTTTGADLSASAMISAAPADSTSLGLLGDPTPAGSTGAAAAVNVDLGLGTASTSDPTAGTTTDVAAAIDLGLGTNGTG
ncbi:DUF320 domain-containing protein, partial [Arthrobacter sp. C152]